MVCQAQLMSVTPLGTKIIIVYRPNIFFGAFLNKSGFKFCIFLGK